MGRKKLILSLVGLAILIIGVPIGIFLVGQSQEIREKAAPATSVSITPSSKTVQVDETFTLNVTVDTAENTISAAEIHLSFDPTLLEAQSISAGSFLTVTILPGTVNNTTGRATITLGAQPTEPKKGTGTLALISFKAKSAGTASVAFAPQTQVAGIGEQGKNVVANNSPATVAINSTSPTATAAPTTAPTTQPTATAAPTTAATTAPTTAATAQPTATAAPTTSSSSSSSSPKPSSTNSANKGGSTATPTTQLPKAGISWPTLTAVLGGIALIVGGIILAF